MVLAVLLGRHLLDFIGGEDFDAAYVVLIPLTFAASMELASVAFEPVLHSMGRARSALVGRLLGFLALAATIAWFAGQETALTVGLAVAVGSFVTFVALGAMAFLALSAAQREARAAG